METERLIRKKIIYYYILMIIFSIPIFYFVISSGRLGKIGLLLMWVPGVSALLVQLFFRENRIPLGWKLGKLKYLGMSFLIPLSYGLAIYLVVWLTGLGEFTFAGFNESITSKSDPGPATNLSEFMGNLLPYIFFNGILGSIVFELGEEIGWRGFLVPHLAKITSFGNVSLISGLSWALWHFPVLIWADYVADTPLWFALPFFLISIVSVSYIFAWMRLKSGSLWTAVILHASHNFFIQLVFTPMTKDTGITEYMIDEFGIGLAVITSITAFFLWKRSKTEIL